MSGSLSYLRQNVRAEPLFNQWYAWPQLLPPVTAAMNVASAHVKVMRSYIASPQVHAQAVKNPAMMGGAFLDLDGKRVDEIKALLDRTLSDSKDLIDLAAAIKSLDDLLQAEGSGFSLDGLYARVPEPLRGYVELVYGMSGGPAVRYLEALLYRSPLYSTARQGLALSLVHGDERPFVLSTPRLPDAQQVQVQVAFADEGLDVLFRAKTDPVAVDDLAARLGVAEADRQTFGTLFTDAAPREPSRYTGAGVRVRYFGHACLCFETAKTTLLTDPAISYSYPTTLPRFSYEDLPPRIDWVILTHAHQDHVMFETLLQLRHRIGTIVVPRSSGGFIEDPSLRLMLERVGFPRVVDLDELQTLDVPGGTITGIPFLGEHGDLNVRTKLGYVVRFGSYSALLAADSNNVEPRLYEHVKGAIGEVDTLFVGMECDGAPYSWAYGALATKPILRKNDQSRRLSGSDFERARRIVETLGCKRVYVYAMGQEPWYGHVMAVRYTAESRPIVESNKLVSHCKERGIEAERLFAQKELTA